MLLLELSDELPLRYVSPACASLLGMPSSEVLGAGLYDLMHADDAAAFRAQHGLAAERAGLASSLHASRSKVAPTLSEDSAPRAPQALREALGSPPQAAYTPEKPC